MTDKTIIEDLKRKFFKEFDTNFYKDVEVGTRGGVAIALVWKEHPTEAKILLTKMFDDLEKNILTQLTLAERKGEEKGAAYKGNAKREAYQLGLREGEAKAREEILNIINHKQVPNERGYDFKNGYSYALDELFITLTQSQGKEEKI